MHFQELSQRVRDAKEDHILITDCFASGTSEAGLRGNILRSRAFPEMLLGHILTEVPSGFTATCRRPQATP